MSEKKTIIKPNLTNESKDIRTNVLKIQDAANSAAEVLPRQLGTDPLMIMQGRYDIRRLTNLNKIDVVWISIFNLLDDTEGGEFGRAFAEQYMNLAVSIDGKRSDQIIKMMLAASGGGRAKKKDDTRNFIEKYLTKRGQEPKDDDIEVE